MAFKIPSWACNRISFDSKTKVFRNTVKQSRNAAAELFHAVTVSKAVADKQYFQLFVYLRFVAFVVYISPVLAVVRRGEIFAVGYDVAAALVRLPVSVVGFDFVLTVGISSR